MKKKTKGKTFILLLSLSSRHGRINRAYLRSIGCEFRLWNSPSLFFSLFFSLWLIFLPDRLCLVECRPKSMLVCLLTRKPLSPKEESLLLFMLKGTIHRMNKKEKERKFCSSLYLRHYFRGISKDRILLKIASTWEVRAESEQMKNKVEEISFILGLASCQGVGRRRSPRQYDPLVFCRSGQSSLLFLNSFFVNKVFLLSLNNFSRLTLLVKWKPPWSLHLPDALLITSK